MPRTYDSDDDEPDYPPPEYHPESDEAGEFRCPQCGSEMYGDAVRCPSCGDYVTPGRRTTASAMPLWMWIALILVALGFLAGIIASIR